MESLLFDMENNIPKEEQAFKKIEEDRIRERCNFWKCLMQKHKFHFALLLTLLFTVLSPSYSKAWFEKTHFSSNR